MNVVLIVVDTLRADHLGCYGYWRETSPIIDQLAGAGIRFADAHATAVATGPAFTCIHTGLTAIHHGFYLTPYDVPNLGNFDDTIPTLAEMLSEHGGITTAAFDNLMSFRSHMKQTARGYEYYVNVTRTPECVHHHVVGGSVNARLLPWIRSHSDERFFLFVHYWDPHTPYNQPGPYRMLFDFPSDVAVGLPYSSAAAGYEYVPGWGTREDVQTPPALRQITGWPQTDEHPIDLYDGEIRYTDDLVGDVLSTLDQVGILNDTAVIITSDHGEQLGQHGLYGHAGLHESNTHIPLLLWNPALLGGAQTIDGYVQHVDIVPTVLDLFGADIPEELDGRSLLPVIRSETATRARIYLEASQQRAVVRDQYKLIVDHAGHRALYDLGADPVEARDLAASMPSLVQSLHNELIDWVEASLSDGRPDPQQLCMHRRKAAGLDPLEVDAPI